MAIVEVQNYTAAASSGTLLYLNSYPTAGNMLTVVSAVSPYGTHISSIFGGGVTWSIAVGASNANAGHVEIWYGTNSNGSSDTITIGYTGTVSSGGVVIEEWSGINAGTPSDQQNNAQSTGSLVNTGSITPINSGELFIGACICQYTLSTGLAQGSWVESGTFYSQTSQKGDAVHLVNSGIGSEYAYGTQSGGTGTYAAVIASFNPKSPTFSNFFFL